ncbi:DNA polymerase I [Pseudoflavonifractor sp. 524-17]|uniref:DNA polymerase I n=1 Tax=Pseudoflavonifractor sp. 524-17 TaxID=2304577 RepID=UPI00137A9E82|nr:DNA polymerase I [Pseudoflavonifractor sp. 524-17]NCE65801.1 DNA polymerase I [Pseudoflavonifractor sp. 524-17]
MKKLMVIDGNSIINRAFYGVRPLATRDGVPTNAVYGFLTILFKLEEEEKPDALCVTFDRAAPTFRHLAYEPYKAQRKGMPEELAAQMPLLKEILEAMNIPRYELDGWEADDLLGTIAAKDAQAGWETVVVTGDKDSLQLITDHTRVKLVTTRMGQTTTRDMTPAAFQADYSFAPIHMIDLKALMGDASDNIPGVKGVGEKTAMALVQLYGSISHLYSHMPEICIAPETPAKPGVVKKLAEGKEMAQLSLDLATIRRDAPIDFQPEDALRRAYNAPLLYERLLRLEFAKLIERLGLKGGQGDAPVEGAPDAAPCQGEIITGPGRAEELLELWNTCGPVGVLALPTLDGVCVAWGEPAADQAAVFLTGKLDGYNGFLRKLFAAPDIQKVSHGVKDLLRALLNEGIEGEGFVFDTAIAAYLLAPTDGSYELEKLSVAYFNAETAKTKDYLDPDAFGPLSSPAEAADALACHAALIHRLWRALAPRLEELHLRQIHDQVELPLCPVLARMERTGFLVDRKALAEFGTMLDSRIETAQASVYQQAGEKFNIHSPKQLGQILFEKMGLPPVKKTKTGYSTSAEVLEKLRGQAPIVDAVLEYRQLTKLASTYVEGLGKVIGPDGRIHTSFQNTVTATGRLSSAEPNLQNIPIRTQLGAELRKMFVPGPGNVLVDADYSQIELRLLAHIAGDAHMIAAFNSGADIHTVTAGQVFGVPPELVTPEMRRRAKAVNFGIVYGISDFSLSEDIGVSRGEAKEYMQRYLETYSGVRAYMAGVVEQARRDGYVCTLMGRRRWLPELKSSNFNLRSFGERVALNMPIQGTAADIIKLAMIQTDRRLREENWKARLVLQVHDELIVECPEEEAKAVKELLKEIMEGVISLSVPLTADAKVGKSWAQAH